ncbi:MAG: GNAT family N-acetyltransferase [Saprospiraceae bacterium]
MYLIEKAAIDDVPEIVHLLNITYRGEESYKGWTTEAGIIKGTIRTDEAIVDELMKEEGSVFFKCLDEKNKLVGCVNLKKKGTKMYLGMLSVQPDLQGNGIGKRFLMEAENWARKNNCDTLFMQVISEREELNDWYKRHGYRETGKKKPFDVDQKYGVPVRPLEFIYLEKQLN